MGSFTKNFRKRMMRTKLANMHKVNLYLMQRVSTLMDEVAQHKEPTLEEINQQRVDLIKSVT
jgi:hypothetical protein